MFKKFKNIWPIWHAGMKTLKNGLSCQIQKHLAWMAAWTKKAFFLCSFLLHATCQTCQMFKRKIVNRPEKTAFWGKLRGYLACAGGGIYRHSNQVMRLYIPPQEGRL